MRIKLIGVGMGRRELLTRQAEQAILESGLLIGAQRLLDEFRELAVPKLPLVKTGDIVEAVRQWKGEQISILLSGDIGFYSGAKNLYPFLTEYEVEGIPGISSLSYFSAKCRQTWQDAHVISCHGRDGGLLAAVQSHPKIFVLTGGRGFRVEELCQELKSKGYGHLKVWAGENLSYPEERILSGTAAELAEEAFSDLAVMLVENPAPIQTVFQAPGLSDKEFIRGKVPMTKEEVRALAVSKLRLHPRDVVWDVGAGTGSVSVECALRLPEGQVYGVECKEDAFRLIQQNREKFQVSNLYPVLGMAPEVLEELPAPDRVFIGGSRGNLREIVEAALDKNPAVRIVLSAITLETLAAALEVIRLYGFRETDVVQVSVSRSFNVASYHMMRAENPVYLISVEGPS